MGLDGSRIAFNIDLDPFCECAHSPPASRLLLDPSASQRSSFLARHLGRHFGHLELPMTAAIASCGLGLQQEVIRAIKKGLGRKVFLGKTDIHSEAGRQDYRFPVKIHRGIGQ